MSPSEHVPERAPFVVVTTEDALVTSSAQALEFLAALGKAPDGVRLCQRLRSETGSREVRLWEAPSLDVMERYVSREFPAGRITGTVGTFAPPDNDPVITIAIADPTPGSGVIVGGKHFGTRKAGQSQLLLVGSIPNGDTGAFPAALTASVVDGHLPAIELSGPPAYTGIQWGDTYAAGLIPAATLPEGVPGLTGVLDQPAFLQIVTAAGKSSNLWPVTFTAQRGVPMLIPGSAFNVDNCAGGGTCATNLEGGTIWGYHDGGLFLSGAGSGTDRYSCQLTNQFVYDHYQWLIQDGVNGGPFGPNEGPANLTDIDLEVSWFYNFGVATDALYALGVFAVGPLGLTGW
jgi:hypothetical protein